ncbi:MAG TPA: EAL domain-containing protein, partial [Solirubrobacterales bacterium]|nr:EAL domain-containing protein [Solirubrobacterales bacterium]
SVNLSAADLLDPSLPREVQEGLERNGVPASALIIELTETSVISDPVRVGDVLGQLGDLGVGLSLDDFGTGYSSLTHLRTLPVGEVKIDRAFVARMGSNAADQAIVRATINLSHDLGKRVVAEGVEDEETWQLLAELGCELIQGYAFSPPLPAEELTPLLASARPALSPLAGELAPAAG